MAIDVFFGGFHLEIGLAIEILGFNIASAFWVAGVQYNEISWNELVFLDFDDLADSHVLPLFLLKTLRFRVVNISDFSLIF